MCTLKYDYNLQVSLNGRQTTMHSGPARVTGNGRPAAGFNRGSGGLPTGTRRSRSTYEEEDRDLGQGELQAAVAARRESMRASHRSDNMIGGISQLQYDHEMHNGETLGDSMPGFQISEDGTRVANWHEADTQRRQSSQVCTCGFGISRDTMGN